MGTHATTKVEVQGKTVVNMYRHYDGYYEAHGRELAEFLQDITLVNGLGADKAKVANGMDDLAALIVVHFKKGPGDFYLTGLDRDEEYDYTIYEKSDKIRMKVRYNGKAMYDGTPAEFLVWEYEAMYEESH